MDSNATEPLKPRVLALIAEGQAAQQEFIASLDEADRSEIGEADAWKAKDQLAHNTAWLEDAARIISAATRGETPDPSPDDNELNPAVFSEKQHESWDKVLSDFQNANRAFITAIEECSEEDLASRTRFAWRNGRPLWYEAYITGYEHPSEHWAQYYLDKGDVKRAQAVRQQIVDGARNLVEETDPFGFMVYNLGTFYAKTGEPEKAFSYVSEALERVPRLREWSKEDPDLASLRDNPEFQALVADPAEANAANS